MSRASRRQECSSTDGPSICSVCTCTPGAASIACGALGAASLGVAVFATDPTIRRASGIVAIGLLAGAAVGGIVTLIRSHRGAQNQGGANAG